MSFTIPETDTYAQALSRCRALITTHTHRRTFNNQPTTYITPSSLTYLTNTLATLPNIKTLLSKHPFDPPLPETTLTFVAEHKIHERAQKELLVTLSTPELDMGFLFALLNVWWPEHDGPLPLPHKDEKELKIAKPYASDGSMDVFRQAQAAFCAPVFRLGEYKQGAMFMASLPVTWAVGVGGPWVVEFHTEHLRRGSEDAEGEVEEGHKYLMKQFESLTHAELDDLAARSVFGFVCEGKYYLVGETKK